MTPDEIKKALEKLMSELGWLHWPEGSSTRSIVEDKIRWIIQKIK